MLCCVMQAKSKHFSGDLKHELTVHCQDKIAIRFIHRFFSTVCVVLCLGGMIIVSHTHSMTHNWCTLFLHRITFFFFFLQIIVFLLNVLHGGSLNNNEKKTHFIARIFFSFFYAHSFNWIWELSAQDDTHTVYSPNINDDCDDDDNDNVRKLV